MALEKHSDQDARISASDPNVIAFEMIEGGQLVHVEIPIDVMQAEFGRTTLEPLAYFESHRDVIEGTAKQTYERLSEQTGHLRISAEDFAAPGSRRDAAHEMG